MSSAGATSTTTIGLDLSAGDHFPAFRGFPDPATALTALNHAPNPS